MGVDEADLPAQQPERPANATTADTTVRQPNSTNNTGLLETPSPPLTPGVVNVRQQHPAINVTLLSKGNKGNRSSTQENKEDDEYTTLEHGDSTYGGSTQLALDCAPSRQPSTKPLDGGAGVLMHPSTTSTNTTNTTTTTSSSRPGVFAVSGSGVIGTSSHDATTASTNITSITSNTTSNTGNTIATRDDTEDMMLPSLPSPPTTIITATKVAPEEEVDEAVRLAQEEAAQLRQQVRSLQQEQRREESQVVVVATADKSQLEQKQRQQDEAGAPLKNRKCLWIGVVLFLGVAIGGGIAISLALETEEAPFISTADPTLSPTMAPTLPCLAAVTPPDKNFTIQLKPLLKVCQGDCDFDSDCDEGLQCYQRSGPFDPVPGCSCWEEDVTRNDYCIPIPTDPCFVETNDYPLGLCEGLCKEDQDCQSGLVCQAVLPGQLIVGCQQDCKDEKEEDDVEDVAADSGGFFSGFVVSNETDFSTTIGNEDNPDNDGNETESNLPDMLPPNNNNDGNETDLIGNFNDTESRLPDWIPDNITFPGGRKLEDFFEEEEEWSWNQTSVKDDNTGENNNADMQTRGPTGELTRPPLEDDLDPLNYNWYCVPAPEDGFETIANNPNDGEFTEDPVPGAPYEDMFSGVSTAGTGLFGIVLVALVALLAW